MSMPKAYTLLLGPGGPPRAASDGRQAWSLQSNHHSELMALVLEMVQHVMCEGLSQAAYDGMQARVLPT